MNFTGDGLNKAAKIIVGILLFLIGCLFLASPVISTVLAVELTGIILIVMGGIELLACTFKKCREGKRPISIVTAIFKLALGIFILAAGRIVIYLLPLIAAIWLAAFGLYRIILGMRQRRNKAENWVTSIAVGVIAITGGIILATLHWIDSVDMIGIIVAILAMLYGFVLLMDALIKSSKESAEEIIAEDKAIANAANAEFYEFEKKLKDK